MKTNPEHEQKRTKFNIACEKLVCAHCGQPRIDFGSDLCFECLKEVPGCLTENGNNYKFRHWYIPARMMPGIQRYIHERIKPGRFLTAVICNNLSDAVGQADDENLENLPAYVSYFYNKAPSDSWGSKKKMNEWLSGGQKKNG